MKHDLKQIATDLTRDSKGWRFANHITDAVEFWCRGPGNSLDGILRVRQDGDKVFAVFHPGSGEFLVKFKNGKATL